MEKSNHLLAYFLFAYLSYSYSYASGSYGSLAKLRSLTRLHGVGNNTVIGASGDYADFQFIQDLLSDITFE